VTQKAKLIRDMFGLDYYDADFSAECVQQNNPLKDMIMVNGFIVPRSSLPKEFLDKL
jgi:hypothetical protein